jgi:hypothetical protein
MESSKFKSNDQRSLGSMFSLTKESTLVNNQKQILFFSLTNLIKYLEYFIFHFKLFCFSLKKNYLFQLITFKKLINFQKINSFSLFFKKIKNNRSTILLFFNIPFLFSRIFSEVFESIIKKTIYLYRFFLLLSIPVLIFSVNQTFVSKNTKNYLSFLLPENKNKIFSLQDLQDEKNFIYIKDLKKNLFHNSILKILSKKIKHINLPKEDSSFVFEKKISYDTSFPTISKEKILSNSWVKKENNFSQIFLLNQSFLRKNRDVGEKTASIDQKRIIFTKWFCFYLKLKKDNLSNLFSWNLLKQNNYFFIKNKNLENFNENSLDFFDFPVFSPVRLLETKTKKKNFFKEEFFQKLDSFFYTVIQPKELGYLSNFPLKILSNKYSFILESLNYPTSDDFFKKKLILKEKTINSIKETEKKKTLFQSLNKQQWIVIIKEWIKLYPYQNNLISFSQHKQNVKENFQSFQKVKFFIHYLKNCFSFWTPVGQIYFGNSLLNRGNFPLIFINNQQLFLFRSYKNAFNFPFHFSEVQSSSNFVNSRFVLLNNSSDHDVMSFSLKKKANKKINKNIKFLYNFYLNFNNSDIFIYPESLFVIQNTTNMSSRFFQGKQKNLHHFFLENPFIYDLDFYLKNSKVNEELFWIPSYSLQRNILDQEKNQQIFNSSQALNLIDFQQKIKKKRKVFQNITSYYNMNFFTKYNKWFFTPQWWLFWKNELSFELQSFIENFTNLRQIFLQNIFTKLNLQNQNSLLVLQKFNSFPSFFIYKFQDWNKFLVEQIYTSPKEIPLWINLKLLLSVNNNLWNFFTWSITSSIVYYHWIPMSTGIIYLFLWVDFEKIRSFSYPSWKTFLSILTHNSFDVPSQQLRLVGYLSRGRIFLIFSKIYKLYNQFFFIFNKFNYITTLDFSRRNKNLVSNSLITKKILQSNYYFWNINKENVTGLIGTNGTINGFNFFQKWYKKNCRTSIFLQRNVFKSFSLNWLNDLFFYNNTLNYGLNSQSRKTLINWKSKPIPLSEPFTYTQRCLFIGSLESGKSFVIKNIAASTYYPLIHISIKDIKNATPDVKYNKIKKQKRWVEQLSERSFFLDNIFHLAKLVSPSIFWISDLHDFDTKNQLQEKNTQKFDISLLMATLLKILSIDLVPEGQNHITFIGSTEYPRLLDPKFVSRQRLDLIINFRTPSFSQRQNIFTSLLKTKGFTIKGLRSFYELNSNTVGYTFRDITSLVNETLLIKTTEKTTLIDSNTIRLALYRQTSTQSVKYKTIIQENLQYKIGKALIQTVLVYPKSIILLSKYHDLWKTKFYYLSNTFLEISNKKTITTEFVLLTQILNCLAGSAARDAWILSTQGLFSKGRISLSLTSQLKHDFSIASNILQSLLVEFSMRDIISLFPTKKKNREDILKTFHFQFLKRAMSYLEFMDQFPSYINWSIKGKRLSFNWILFFNGIEHSTKNLTRLLSLDKNKKNIFSPILSKNNDVNIPYDRRETKRQQQKIQKIDLFFNKLVYSMYMENLGFPWESNYVMDYNPFQFSLFFRDARPLWNPQTIMPSYSILFFDRDLLINQKLLTKLYITYGNKFQLEKLNRKRIKKQMFWSNSSFTNVDLNKTPEIKNDFRNYQILPQGTHLTDFHFHQNLINLNAQLDQSQIQLPVYLHQGWITADPTETSRIFDILATQKLINNEQLIYKESFLFEILLEIYHYLLKFFIQKKYIMIQIKEILINNEILYREDIENVMKKYY